MMYSQTQVGTNAPPTPLKETLYKKNPGKSSKTSRHKSWVTFRPWHGVLLEDCCVMAHMDDAW